MEIPTSRHNIRCGKATDCTKSTDAISFHVGKVLESVEDAYATLKRGSKPCGMPPHMMKLCLPPDALQVLVFVIIGDTEQIKETKSDTSQLKGFGSQARIRILEQPGETASSTVCVIDQWNGNKRFGGGPNKTERLDTVVVDVTEQLKKQSLPLDVISEPTGQCEPDLSAEGLRIDDANVKSNTVVLSKRVVKRVAKSKEQTSKQRRLNTSTVTCEICNIHFTSKSAFDFHPCQQEKVEEYFVCKICGEKYNDQSEFWSHYHSHEGRTRGRRGKCVKCLQSFPTSTLLKEHSKECNHASHVQCTLCEKKFSSHIELRKHKRLAHLQKYTCQKCNEMFSTKVELAKHHKTTHSVKHQCRLCTQIFPDKSSLLKHRLDLHPPKMHTCDVCDQNFTKKSSMDAHRDQHFAQKNSNAKDKVLLHAEEDELKENDGSSKNSFVCDKCGCTFANEQALQTHVLSHSEGSLSCSKCNVVMRTQEDLFQHEKCHETKLVCEQCGRQYLRMRELRKHMTTHSEERPFPCVTCGFRFYTEDRLRIHQRVHEEKRFLCNLCPMKFTDNEHLRRHLKSHTSTNRQRVNSCVFHCMICPETFESPARLVQHYESVHPVAEFTCVECNIHVATFDLMKEHFRSQHVGRVIHCCRVCGDAFNNRQKLETHRTYSHNKVVRRQPVIADIKITCSACQKTFNSTKLYHNHLMDAKCKEAATEKESDSTPFKCLSCNEEFPASSYLQTHNAVHSTNFPFPCHLCGKPLVGISEVTDHLNQHMAIGVWSCIQCSKTLSTRQSLRMHMASHGVISPFTCATCNKTFNSRGALATHTNIHTGEQPYRCNLPSCNASFKQPNQLKAHLLAHDGRKTYECAECNKSFWARSALVSHLKNHITEQNTPTHECNICSKTFNRKANLSNHLRSHKGEKGLLKKRFGCKRCKRNFTTQAHLIIHEHMHDSTDLVCPVCQRKFKTLHWLQMHMRIHTSESPICPICDKSFTIQRSLEQHMDFHTEQNDVQCPTCKSKFRSERGLHKHNIQCHSGFSGQVCRLCGLGFATRTKFNTHVTMCDIKQNRRTTENAATSTMKSGQSAEDESTSQHTHALILVPGNEPDAVEEELPGAPSSIMLSDDSCHVMIQEVLHAIEEEKVAVGNPEGAVELEQLVEEQAPTELFLDGPQGKVRVQLVYQSTS